MPGVWPHTLAERCGVIVQPRRVFTALKSTGFVRIAVVQPTAALELALSRAGDAANTRRVGCGSCLILQSRIEALWADSASLDLDDPEVTATVPRSHQ